LKDVKTQQGVSINLKPGVAIITGASGQDGYFLIQRLLLEGWVVHATTRTPEALRFLDLPAATHSRLQVHEIDLLHPNALHDLIVRTRPDEFYNLAGQSSVSKSFADPIYTWRTNAETVVHLLECIRTNSPETRFYQASSTDMFGVVPGATTHYEEGSRLNPQSPYASAKAAAHMLCHSYREAYDLRIACGILANHESHRRPASFLSRKVVDHVLQLKRTHQQPPLTLGNLKARRDWGFAPDYVEGICKVARQIDVRPEVTAREKETDRGQNYRDYVLATGDTHAVWEMVACAFTIAGFDLDWNLEGDDPASWRAVFRSSGSPAVVVNPDLLRAAEPLVIQVDPGRACRELGWAPRRGLEVFLEDMIGKLGERKPAKQA
jgi:GDPmannose 4,6-dehydratase